MSQVKIWRQKNSKEPGKLVDYNIDNIYPDMSFLEMLDVLNSHLIDNNKDPVSFDHDCREGICGSCSLFINGRAHGPDKSITSCQLHMRKFKDGDTIYYDKHAGHGIQWEDTLYQVIRDRDVILVE